jgi:hypothetical protein
MSTVEIVALGGDLREDLQLTAFAEFGVYVYRSRRLHLAIRCGGKPGPYAHEDQLGFELAIDGEDWVVDPGSYVLEAAPAWRNAYRAASAHAAPRFEGTAPARCLVFEPARFVGERRRVGQRLRRTFLIEAETISIVDDGAAPLRRLVGRAAVQAHFAPAVPYSPGYGKRLRGARR